jgi:hypothetical protein
VELAKIAAQRNSPPAWFLFAANLLRWIPVPEGLWIGVVSLFQSNAAQVPVYMLGQVYPNGHPLYFVLATVLKLPLSTQILFLFGAGLLVQRLLRHQLQPPDLLWIAPGFLYFTLASMANLHLGARLVMPSWAFFILIGGAAAHWLLITRKRITVLCLLVALLAAMSASVFPHGLAAFNPFVGGARNALRYLADSNIDWGQALRDVAVYTRRHDIKHLNLAYFGFDRPQRFFAPGSVTNIPAPWEDRPDTPERLVPAKGWYAISASLLPGHFFLPKYREYYAEFRQRRPVAVAGGSIFIYRVE